MSWRDELPAVRGKLLFGYQGWFGCPDDGSPLGAWEHWFRRGAPASAEALRVDTWPDVSELGPDERCATPLSLADGRPADAGVARDVGVERRLAVDEQRAKAERSRVVGECRLEVFDEDVRNGLFQHCDLLALSSGEFFRRPSTWHSAYAAARPAGRPLPNYGVFESG